MKVYLYDIFHRCDSLTDWIAFDCSLTLSSAQRVEGVYSLKMTADAGLVSFIRYDRDIDWSEFSEIVFWVYHPGYTNEIGYFYLLTDAVNYSYWEFDFAAEWTERTIDLSSPPDGSVGTLDLSNIKWIKIYQWSITFPGEDYYFDFIRGASIDITSDITYIKITEEMGVQSVAELNIKGDTLDHFQSGLEMWVYDSDDVLSWTGRVLYPEAILEGTKVIGKLKVIGQDSQFNNAYRKNFTVVRDSDYIIKNIIDNVLPGFTYDDEIDDFAALTYKYDLKTKIRKMMFYLSMLERAVIGYKPDGEMFFNKYNNLTATGKSWNQNTSHVKITSYTPVANRHVTKTPVIGANNSLGQVYYVGSATDTILQKFGINELQPWRDPEITNYTEAKQLGDNLQIIYSMDTQMISMLVVGKKHIQVGYTVELEWAGVFTITKKDFLVTKRVWYPIIDVCNLELTDNILTRKAFNIRVINKFYDEDAQQGYEEPDVAESTMAGTVLPLMSIAELRAKGLINCLIATGTYTGNAIDNREFDIGFTPKIISIVYRLGEVDQTWQVSDTFPAWECIYMYVNEHLDNAINIITGGFEVNNGRADDHFNLNNEVYHYVAWG